MKFGCSECLSIAIESHRPDLLKSLLERPNVAYRDMFWAPPPIEWSSSFKEEKIVRCDEYPPILHEVTSSTDLSFVGRDDCGHKCEDEELVIPLSNDVRERVLVSLPMLSRWHSSEDFAAEQMLRQSGKFDFTEMQFFHIRNGSKNCDTKETVLAFSHEKSSQSICQRLNTQLSPLLFGGSGEMWGRYQFGTLELRYTNQLYPLLLKLDPSFDYEHWFQPELLKQIENGADLNNYLAAHCSYRYRSTNTRKVGFRGLSSILCLYCERSEDPEKLATGFQTLLRLLLRHGLSYFLGERSICHYYGGWFSLLFQFIWSESSPNLKNFEKSSFFDFLFSKCGEDHREFCRGVACQLLALGFGRRELHPHDVPLFDEHLECTREAVHNHQDRAIYFGDSKDKYCLSELQLLVDLFDAGPLSLLRLSRIAVRRAIGGTHFATRIRAIVALLPPALYDYVADPTELIPPPASMC